MRVIIGAGVAAGVIVGVAVGVATGVMVDVGSVVRLGLAMVAGEGEVVSTGDWGVAVAVGELTAAMGVGVTAGVVTGTSEALGELVVVGEGVETVVAAVGVAAGSAVEVGGRVSLEGDPLS